MVSLRPMEPDAWEAWRVAAIRDYAAEKVRAGTWSAESAETQANDEFARLIPDGQRTAGHEFRAIVTDAGETVGTLWFAAQDEIGRGAAFIYDIVIDPAQRGRGYGREAMEALEPLARSLGYHAIRLHVFGHNAVARHLYETVGYAETDLTMMKRIG
ncbi:MAG TPA: GNAT family N-acetyltransferase [Candidatus Deferrimicrobium sp.]|nr:GNAT family N-acetyltransferase [Candidatus Deferrimicrobium sp.]